MPPTLTCYLAGPDVFLPDAVELGRRKKALCARYGFEGLFPFDNEVTPDESSAPPDALIFRANEAMIRSADFGIFNLTPFRGPSADVGTVFELGLLIGLGKPAFGYTNDAADLLERVRRSARLHRDVDGRTWRDADGMAIEDFGNADNLMIDLALVEGGFPIVRHSASAGERFRDLTGFEACLRLAAASLLTADAASGAANPIGVTAG